jgi:hypothetical protein
VCWSIWCGMQPHFNICYVGEFRSLLSQLLCSSDRITTIDNVNCPLVMQSILKTVGALQGP